MAQEERVMTSQLELGTFRQFPEDWIRFLGCVRWPVVRTAPSASQCGKA